MAKGLRAAHYAETEAKLAESEIIKAMAAELPAGFKLEAGGYHGFMLGANAEYKARCEAAGAEWLGGHLGAVVAALASLREDCDLSGSYD